MGNPVIHTQASLAGRVMRTVRTPVCSNAIPAHVPALSVSGSADLVGPDQILLLPLGNK